MCIKICCEEKHVDLLLIGEERNRHYDFIKDFNTFMYDHTLHRGRKHFCWYCLQAFSLEEILKSHIKDCFKINGKQRILINGDFESILVPENSRKQNPNESYTNKYQKHVACSYGYKLLCIDYKFGRL